MPLTPETLPRHELVGLHAEVVGATNPDLVGVAGRVVAETERTLVVRSDRERRVPKRGATFAVALTDEAAAPRKGAGTASERGRETAGVRPGKSGSAAASAAPPTEDREGVAYVTVDGERLLSRPARRTETTGDSRWR